METLQFTVSNFPSEVTAFVTSLKQYVWLLLSHGTLILPPSHPGPPSALHFQALNLYQAIPFPLFPVTASNISFYSTLLFNIRM